MAISAFFLKRNPYLIAFKAIQFIGPVAGLLLIIGMVTVWYLQNSPQELPIKYKLITPERSFYLESASTPEELYKGLKFRNHLPSDRGMLFHLGKRQTNVGFWMYKVSMPLDIIYLDNSVGTCQKDFDKREKEKGKGVNNFNLSPSPFPLPPASNSESLGCELLVTKVVHAPPCPQLPCPIYYAPSATHILEIPPGLVNIQPGLTLKIFKYSAKNNI